MTKKELAEILGVDPADYTKSELQQMYDDRMATEKAAQEQASGQYGITTVARGKAIMTPKYGRVAFESANQEQLQHIFEDLGGKRYVTKRG